MKNSESTTTGPDLTTLEVYRDRAAALADTHDTVDRGPLWDRIMTTFHPGDRVLELGCGGGVDAAALLNRGVDIVATDGSPEMLDQAHRRHPDLAERLQLLVLPSRFPFLDAEFDGVFAIATLQHLSPSAHAAVLPEIHRVLRPHGAFILKTFEARPDLDDEGRDAAGRLMTILSRSDLVDLFSVGGRFSLASDQAFPDLLNRSGFRCRLYEFRRG